MKPYLSYPENRTTILLDKFIFISTNLVEFDDDSRGEFIIHFVAFHHQSIAIFAVSRADENKFGKIPSGIVGVKIFGAGIDSFHYFCFAVVVFGNIFEK